MSFKKDSAPVYFKLQIACYSEQDDTSFNSTQRSNTHQNIYMHGCLHVDYFHFS